MHDGGSSNALGLAFTLLMCCTLVALPRRTALFPVLALVCYMTMGERIIVGGLNFTMMRVMLLFGWMRVIARSEWSRFRWNPVDGLVIAWAVLRTINYTLVWNTSHAFINRTGYAYDIVGSYFLFRFLVRDAEDVQRALRYLAIFIVPLAGFIVMEKVTGRNPFAMFGGVPLTPEVRDGTLRCQGPFSHSILAGTFAATSVPLFVGTWFYRRKNGFLAVLAVVSAIVIIVMGASSGPILAFGFGAIALMMWPIRSQMRLVRWLVVAALLAMQMLMNAPIWFVLARLTVFSGSTGWFRGFLIDMTVKHFDEWWFIGSKNAGVWHWFLLDVTNQYVAEGLDGGLVVLVLFVCILGFAFRAVGRAARTRSMEASTRRLGWALGAALLAHSVTFISVTYFDQNAIMFYLLLASIAAVGSTALQVKKEAAPAVLEPALSTAGPWSGHAAAKGEWNV